MSEMILVLMNLDELGYGSRCSGHIPRSYRETEERIGHLVTRYAVSRNPRNTLYIPDADASTNTGFVDQHVLSTAIFGDKSSSSGIFSRGTRSRDQQEEEYHWRAQIPFIYRDEVGHDGWVEEVFS